MSINYNQCDWIEIVFRFQQTWDTETVKTNGATIQLLYLYPLKKLKINLGLKIHDISGLVTVASDLYPLTKKYVATQLGVWIAEYVWYQKLKFKDIKSIKLCLQLYLP